LESRELFSHSGKPGALAENFASGSSANDWRLQHHAHCGCVKCIDHPSQAKPGVHVFPDRLHVLTMLENPQRWRSRYWNYWMFERECEAAGAILHTAEVAFGERHFEVTRANDPRHLQLRTTSEIWHKENALNLLIQRLPADAKYVAWVDADLKFARPDWAQETLQQLQHYDVVQMFSHAQDVGPEYEPLRTTPGFLYKWVVDRPSPHDADFGMPRTAYGYYSVGSGQFWHPGFAWAAKRSVLDSVGMLIDWAILGSGDWHMASALVGQVERSLCSGYSPAYIRMCRDWQAHAEKHIRRNVGYVPGLVNHFFHGTKRNRVYDQRWRLLAQTGYDPQLDLKRDWQGLFQLTERSAMLRDGIRQYGRMRNEDVTETGG
jgi:hypothetical protein